jgi:tetratricopeptide (TPR) repeat protein
MAKLFISHSSKDDAFVRDLRFALADHGQDGWIDSRELRGGDPLLTEIQKAIEDASAYAIVVSTDALQSKWVGKELKHALKVRDERGTDKFPVIPLSLNGTKLGVLEEFFDEEPIYIAVSSEAGGVEAAMNALLVAMGERLPADIPATVQPKAEPLEELVLELTDLKFVEQDGVRRASARARLVYEPATLGKPNVISEKSWRFIAPLGPVESEELRWYLEKYAIWPSHYFRERARKVEKNLRTWGQLLHKKAMPAEHTANVMNAWARIAADADRRFSVYVDMALEAGAPDDDAKTARETATSILALPWELLHDGEGYLFQGAKPMRVRRRLPNTKVLDVPVVATPIRILLVTARPEDDECEFLDHRASALPLVEAMESLPGLVKIQILSPPTLPALRDELDRARSENKPYHVVHFNGYGAFDPELGVGGLCFENPEDTGKLEYRGHVTVFTSELGPLLRDHRIPLVFLEACQAAQTGKASQSVALELLNVGVASVVAMSYTVMLETTGRFVGAFYGALARGDRVGDAMLAGQRELKDNTFRASIFGAGELRLQDWFVPVLYQEKDDPQLFKTTPTKQTQDDFHTALAARLGDLPPEPETGFIGRSRELLGLQRLLRSERYAVIRGQGGEGTTALAAEFARWMVRSQQVRRAAFVSVETHGSQRAVVEALGKQVVQRDFTAAGDLEDAILKVERALREQSTLLVMDNIESVLPPPFRQHETPPGVSENPEWEAILALCERLLNAGDTRVVFTSREALPAPFDGDRHRRELDQLDLEDAVKLVERALNASGSSAGSSNDAAREEIEEFVDGIHCHVRTLSLLAPSLRVRGVEATRESLVDLMAETENNFPRSRENSVFASVEFSLRRMSEANRNRARVLAVFHGGVQLRVLTNMMQWEDADVSSLADELIETGLATAYEDDYLTLNPALCPYFRSGMDAAELESLTQRWADTMYSYVKFLDQERTQNPETAATLTMLEVPNLSALLDVAQNHLKAEDTIFLAGLLYGLLETSGKPRLLQRVGQVRDAATALLTGSWNYAQAEAARTRIEQLLAAGRSQEALEAAQDLHRQAMKSGEQAYPGADYDMAMACGQLARVLRTAGNAEQALPLLDEARRRFETIVADHPGTNAEDGVAKCFLEQGECYSNLGRLDEAMAAVEEYIRRAEKLGDHRGIAIANANIGGILRDQGLYAEALQTWQEARERFTQLNDPDAVAVTWHQLGMVYRQLGDPEAAEDAYRESLAIRQRRGDVTGQASTLNELGLLYKDIGRMEEAAGFFQQAVEKSVEVGDSSGEGLSRNNLAAALRSMKQFDKARAELLRAIKCGSHFGHVSQPWTSWSNLADIETEAGNAVEAANAKRKAVECYFAYRREGGENHGIAGRIMLNSTKPLLAGDDAAATSFLQEIAAEPDVPAPFVPFIRALQSIIAGSRDRTLADNPDFDYEMAAETLLLIEMLETRSQQQ